MSLSISIVCFPMALHVRHGCCTRHSALRLLHTLKSVPRLAEYVTLADLVVEVRGMCEVKATRCTCCLGWSEPEQCHGIVSSL